MVYREQERAEPSELEQRIEPFLKLDEQIEWVATPRRGIVFRKFDFLMVPFSLVWGGFAFLWETMAIVGGAPGFFPLFGLPFVMVGLYLIFGRFLWDAYRRGKTVYALTDSRLLILEGGSLKSLDLLTLGEVRFEERANGGGTLSIGAEGSRMQLQIGSKKGRAIVLDIASDARRVYRDIMEAQDRVRQRQAGHPAVRVEASGATEELEPASPARERWRERR